MVAIGVVWRLSLGALIIFQTLSLNLVKHGLLTLESNAEQLHLLIVYDLATLRSDLACLDF